MIGVGSWFSTTVVASVFAGNVCKYKCTKEGSQFLGRQSCLYFFFIFFTYLNSCLGSRHKMLKNLPENK